MISYNVANIHQILTLNFFRYLDQLHDTSDQPFKEKIDEIYHALHELSDEKLVVCLENIGKALSDTSEFNFYGAHRIDFSTIIEMSDYKDGKLSAYTLNMQSLIDSLEANDLTLLHEATEHFSGAFRSYRFIAYLLTKVSSELGKIELNQLLSLCHSSVDMDTTHKENPGSSF